MFIYICTISLIMKSSPIIVIFTLLACLCVEQPLPETLLDGNFPSGNELLTSNYDDNFEDHVQFLK